MNDHYATKKDLEKLEQNRVDDIEQLRQERRDDIAEIKAILLPISETYSAVSFLGKWFMAFLVLISISLGILLSFREFFKVK